MASLCLAGMLSRCCGSSWQSGQWECEFAVKAERRDECLYYCRNTDGRCDNYRAIAAARREQEIPC
jgi:hypothetical protein